MQFFNIKVKHHHTYGPHHVLESLSCSDDEDNGSFAVDVILQVSKGKYVGDVRVRVHKTPKYSVHTQSCERAVRQVAQSNQAEGMAR